jgi:hypothetical protein
MYMESKFNNILFIISKYLFLKQMESCDFILSFVFFLQNNFNSNITLFTCRVSIRANHLFLYIYKLNSNFETFLTSFFFYKSCRRYLWLETGVLIVIYNFFKIYYFSKYFLYCVIFKENYKIFFLIMDYGWCHLDIWDFKFGLYCEHLNYVC